MHAYIRTCLHTYIPTYVHNIFILGADDMGISGDLLPRTLSRWHEHGFDPKHVQADDLRVVDHPIIFFVRRHFWVLLADYMRLCDMFGRLWPSHVFMHSAAQGRNKKKKHCCLRHKSTWDEFSTLASGMLLVSEPLAESLHLLLHAWRPCLNIFYNLI